MTKNGGVAGYTEYFCYVLSGKLTSEDGSYLIFAVLGNCNKDLKEIIENPSCSNAVVSYYLQLALIADKNEEYGQYLNIYEPLILLYEQGGNFVYRERGMSFIGSGMIPLKNWQERFSKKELS